MDKQQIIHHIARRLEFLLNHSDGADRPKNADRISELSAIMRDITLEQMPNMDNMTGEMMPATGPSNIYSSQGFEQSFPSGSATTLSNSTLRSAARSLSSRHPVRDEEETVTFM